MAYTASDKNHFPWIPLTSIEQLQVILHESANQPIILFKHSTRCGISKRVLSNFENEWTFDTQQARFYYLDLLAYRDVSNYIAEVLQVQHQSPQIIVINNQKVEHHASHADIQAEEVHQILNKIG